MSQPATKPSGGAYVFVAMLGLGIFAVAVAWLAAAIFAAMIGVSVDATTPLTGWQYYSAYGGHPGIQTRLMVSHGIALLGLGIPMLLILKPKKATLHGDAQWATKAQIKASGLLSGAGIIVGKHKGKFLQLPGQQHVIVAAPTRSGKGVGIVIPNLLAWPDSVVVLDIKQENYNLTAGFRARHGQQVFLFNPTSATRQTHRWNPLGYINLEDPAATINDVQKIANFLFIDVEGTDPIWSASSRSLFVGVVLFIIETPGLPLTMGEVLRQVTAHEEAGKYFQRVIEERKEEGNPLSAVCVQSLNDFIATSTNTRSSIRKTFSSRFELWLNPMVDAATEVNDFDLRDLRRKRMSVYLAVTPDDLGRLAPILNLFFQQVLDLNTKVLPSDDSTLKHQCLLLLDEFTALGKIPILSKAISYIAGYNLRMLPIIQSPAQIREVYGKDAAETFLDNHALHVVYTPKNIKIATEVSEAMGNQTWSVKSLSRSLGFGKANRSQSVSEQKRALMLPQELVAMSQDLEILMLEACPPIRCDKIRYYQDPTFKGRLLPPPPLPSLVVTTRTDILSAASLMGDDSGESKEPEETERPFTMGDIDKIDSLTLDDFSFDFSGVPLEATELDPAEAQALALKVLNQNE